MFSRATPPGDVDPELRYLHADRQDFGQLQATAQRDFTNVEERLMQGHAVSPVDCLIASLAIVDLEVSRRILVWSAGKSIYFDAVQSARDPIVLARQARHEFDMYQKSLYKQNLQAFRQRTDGVSDPLGAVAVMGMANCSSEAYEKWSPTFFELWTRSASHFASLPVIRRFLLQRSRPRTGPSNDEQLEVVQNCVDVSFALRAVRERIYDKIPCDGPAKRHFDSMSGLLSEIDGLLRIYEEGSLSPASNTWVFPAPPNMDFGSKTKIKADQFSVVFGKGDSSPVVYYFSNKMREIKNSRQSAKDGVNVLGANHIGNMVLRDGRLVCEPGVLSDTLSDELDSVNNNPRDAEQRIARGLAVLGIDVAETVEIAARRPELPFVTYPSI